jgi:hypothetical protein
MLAAVVVALAVSTIHPFIAAMAATALAGFAGLHLLLGVRRRAAWAQSAALGVLIAAVLLLPVVELALSRGDDALVASFPASVEGWPVDAQWVAVLPGVYLPTLAYHGPLPSLQRLEAGQAGTGDDPFLMWRFAVNMGRRRLILFDLDRYIADPNLLFEPPYLLALLILPFLPLGIRRDMAPSSPGSTGHSLLAMFNLAHAADRLAGDAVDLWRFVWVSPTRLIIGLLARLAARIGLRPRPTAGDRSRHRSGRGWRRSSSSCDSGAGPADRPQSRATRSSAPSIPPSSRRCRRADAGRMQQAVRRPAHRISA